MELELGHCVGRDPCTHHVESMNRSGGMALMWKEEVKIKQVIKAAFTIEAHVEDRETKTTLWFIGIYASCDNLIRKSQWKVVKDRKKLWGEKWIIAGDFNDILSNEEKWEGRWREENSFTDFNNFINDNQLVDIGFEGNPWTWSNNWEDVGEVKERLNRGLCCIDWSLVFDKANCKHIDTFASDHSILMIDTNPETRKRKKRFYFDKRWLKREGIQDVIRNAWEKIVRDQECLGSNAKSEIAELNY
ncbi:uncharacterized protein LOC113771340 [Coffea eugenioides]|uniref:uncharacterized protein LOC113771340 n=1 Tax=Coffea eugenioides TaxID=49369 RepID=UPI000F610CE6|nr:uncharacterized protein LOC113771340 [Coffea eugenioides]